MKTLVALLALAVVFCAVIVHGEDEEKQVIEEMSNLTNSTEKFVAALRKYLSSRKKIVDKVIADRLKELGNALGAKERDLSQEMFRLGEALGIPPPPGLKEGQAPGQEPAPKPAV